MWQTGDRVLASRPSGPHLYPGTVHSQDGSALHVFFDDGEEARVPAGQLYPLQVEPGDRIEVRLPATRHYTPAVVGRCDGERLSIELEDGTQEWTSSGMIRIDPAVWKSGGGRHGWTVGDRVLAYWRGDGYWYAGTVQGVDRDNLHVYYDDGDKEWCAPDRVASLGELREGTRVLGRWQGGLDYYPGQITSREGEHVTILYDDGERETTSLSMVRVRRGESPHSWRSGHRVLAQSQDDDFLYPGTVAKVEEDTLYVQFDDGDRAQVSPERVMPLDVLRAGTHIECRWQGGDFFPGRIARREGEQIFVQYEDGDREQTVIGMARVWPEHLAGG
jgi:hypothetical protein